MWPLLFLATLAVYASVLHGGFLWDDDAYVWQNAALTSLHGLGRIWLKPGAVDSIIRSPTPYSGRIPSVGLNTFGYHLLNVLLHSFNALFVGLALTRLRVRGAWLAAFLFAVHPVHLESVAWITELRTFCRILLSDGSLAFLDYEESGAGSRRLLSLALFTCSLLCKSVTCTLPVVMLLLAWARRGRLDERN